MAEQEIETEQLDLEQLAQQDPEPAKVNAAADKKVKTHLQRGILYVVLKEFTHKRTQPVGSIFRPRRYPRLRPLRLRELIADGYIKPATKKDKEDYSNAMRAQRADPPTPEPVVETTEDTGEE
jgi:hypothetical protein